MDFDVSIIGAGLGGLSAGAYLARHGMKVLIVEQHNIVGGAATHFSRQRTMKFEVGLHEMDSVGSERGKRVLQSLGVWNDLEFIRVPEFYRIKYKEVDLVVSDDIHKARSQFHEAFPDESVAIDTYFSDIEDIRQGIELTRTLNWMSIWKIVTNIGLLLKLLKFKKMTAGKYFDDLTDNFGLKVALLANMGYFHDNAYELSMLLFAAGQSSYMSHGGWFIKGGSQLLSDSLANVIRDNGGTVITKHMVKEILVEDGKAVGISYQRKNRKDAELISVNSRYVVYNGGLPLLPKLLPSLQSQDLKFQQFKHGVSLMTIYISFNQPIADLTGEIYSTFVINDEIDSLTTMAETERSTEFEKRGFVFVDYGSIDSGLETEKHYTGVICGFDYMKHWEGLEKHEYKEKKEMVMNIFLNQLEQLFPGITERIQYSEMATARTIKRYTLNPSGTVYGFAPTTEQFLIDRTKDIKKQVKNLEFASAWTTMGGFSPAISGGRQAAKRILKEIEIKYGKTVLMNN